MSPPVAIERPAGTPDALRTLAFSRSIERHLIPKLKAFLQLYPEIMVELRVTDAFVDLHEHDIDVAVRVGEARGDRLIAKKVCDLKRLAVGATSYFEQRAVPRKPHDLRDHACVVVGHASATEEWVYLTASGVRSSVTVAGRVVVDNYLALRTAVEAGLGIGPRPVSSTIPKDWPRGDCGVSCPTSSSGHSPCILSVKDTRLIPARVRLFIDFLFADLRRQPWAAV